MYLRSWYCISISQSVDALLKMQHVTPVKENSAVQIRELRKPESTITCSHIHKAQFCPQQGQKFNDSSQQIRGVACMAQHAILVPDDDQVSSSDTPGAVESLKANKPLLDILTLCLRTRG